MKNPVLFLTLIFVLAIFSFIGFLVLFPTQKLVDKIQEEITQQRSPLSPSLTPTKVLGTQAPDQFTVKKVIDGDTVELENSSKVRYIGIDTPETVDPRRGVGCFGKEASNKNKELVEGKNITLEKDVSETDRFGRLLRYVYVDLNGRSVMVNEYLVKEGFARASSFPPDVKHQQLFQAAEKEARENKRGLWGFCPIS